MIEQRRDAQRWLPAVVIVILLMSLVMTGAIRRAYDFPPHSAGAAISPDTRQAPSSQ
jgi:hypothetical protein